MSDTLILRGSDDFISIEVVPNWSDPQGNGDVYVLISVSSSGYSGKNDLWVDGEALRSFVVQLADLNQSLKGKATLQSMSPGELELTIQSVSSRGHLAVSGSTGYQVLGENSSWWHSVTFGFEFEQSQLQEAIKRSWLNSYIC
ncbi:MAG: hypothetical protein SF172_16235 [Burkholderiales bacterium]|nr:hypothetical protein [Burkholderiales bacterium]